VLIFGVPVEARDWRLQDMSSRCSTGRNTPTVILKEQCSLRLCSGKAELAGIPLGSPRPMIFCEEAQPLSDLRFVQPKNVCSSSSQDAFNSFWTDELYRSGAVFPHICDQPKWAPRGYLKSLRPPAENSFIVRK